MVGLVIQSVGTGARRAATLIPLVPSVAVVGVSGTAVDRLDLGRRARAPSWAPRPGAPGSLASGCWKGHRLSSRLVSSPGEQLHHALSRSSCKLRPEQPDPPQLLIPLSIPCHVAAPALS